MLVTRDPGSLTFDTQYAFSSLWMELSWKHFKNVILPKAVVWRVEFGIYEGTTPTREEMRYACLLLAFL